MGPTALFTHLKIILLQCFQFSVFSFNKISSIQTNTECQKLYLRFASPQNLNAITFHYKRLKKKSLYRMSACSRSRVLWDILCFLFLEQQVCSTLVQSPSNSHSKQVQSCFSKKKKKKKVQINQFITRSSSLVFIQMCFFIM